MTPFPLRCGRLDRHEPHDWYSPRNYYPGRTYHCTGHVISEAAWRDYDACADADEAAQDRAERARKESA